MNRCLCGEHSSQLEHWREEHERIENLIVLYKIAYYYHGFFPKKGTKASDQWFVVDDDHYESFELQYVALCDYLGLPNLVVHQTSPDYPEHLNGTGMLEVDFSAQVTARALTWAEHTFPRLSGKLLSRMEIALR